jgi:hypothetical protein
MTSGLTGGPGRRRALSPARHARPRPHSSGRGLRGPDTTVFRVEGSQLLQVFSAYLGIDTTTTGSCPAAMHYRRAVGLRARRCDRSRSAWEATKGQCQSSNTFQRSGFDFGGH